MNKVKMFLPLIYMKGGDVRLAIPGEDMPK
jgi:hypothetical protein